MDSEIKKAFEAVSVIQKAYDELKKSHDDLEARVKTIEETKVQKGGIVIVSGTAADDINPALRNFEMLGGQ